MARKNLMQGLSAPKVFRLSIVNLVRTTVNLQRLRLSPVLVRQSAILYEGFFFHQYRVMLLLL